MCVQSEPGSLTKHKFLIISLLSLLCLFAPRLHDPCLPLLSLPSYRKSNTYLLYTQNYFISQNENIKYVCAVRFNKFLSEQMLSFKVST